MSEPRKLERSPAGNVWDEQFGCHVLDLHYDFKSRVGAIRLLAGDSCDMKGCLTLFRSIDPEVVQVATYSGESLDTIYRRSGDTWVSHMPDFRKAEKR